MNYIHQIMTKVKESKEKGRYKGCWTPSLYTLANVSKVQLT
jgi:hypothetical protein